MKGFIYYMLNRAKFAKRAMEVDNVKDMTLEKMEQLQREYTPQGNPELTTVCLTTEKGDFISWIGPTGFYRKSNLRVAGVSFPGYPSTERMKLIGESKVPWVDIEKELPRWLSNDIAQGYTEVEVKTVDGETFFDGVTDHQSWYHVMKEMNVTHWRYLPIF